MTDPPLPSTDAVAAPSELAPRPGRPSPPARRIGAAVDVGATSVHLLVAAVEDHVLEPLVDESVFLGLGDRVATHAYLGRAARAELTAALAEYAGAARHLGASAISLVGTEPVRRAADAAALVHETRVAAGVPLHVLDHHEEALLNLLGVTRGRPVTEPLGVVDVGGGSSEIALVGPDEPLHGHGLRLGASRLTQAWVTDDPPTEAELRAMAAEARRVVAGGPRGRPAALVAVGGTASNLVKVLPEASIDRILTRDRLAASLDILRSEPSEALAARFLLRAARVRLLPAGAVILDAILERYDADRMRVSEAGIREGAVLAATVAGRDWRDRLGRLVEGWP